MTFKEYIKTVKQDISRSYAITKNIEHTYFFRICVVFVLNILGIIGFFVMKEDFPLSVFCAIWGISALIIIDVLWHILSENIAKNLPDAFADEFSKHGIPAHEFRCGLDFVGNIRFKRYKYCRLYIYSDIIIVRFFKRCLIIDDIKQIKLDEVIIGYRCEFNKAGQYVLCNVNKEQAQILRQWIENKHK